MHTALDATTNDRLAAWTQNSCDASSTNSCPVDLFSVNGKNKVRVQVVTNKYAPSGDKSHVQSSVWFFGIAVAFTLALLFAMYFQYTQQRQRRPSQGITDEPKTTPSNLSVAFLSTQSDVLTQNTSFTGEQTVSISVTNTRYVDTHSTRSSALLMEEVQMRAKEMTAALQVAHSCLREAGHEVDTKDLIPWITQQQLACVDKTDKDQREIRRYMFETQQNEMNREHMAGLQQEDPQWLDRLRESCDLLTDEVGRASVKMLLFAMCGQIVQWILHSVQQTSSSSMMTGIANTALAAICGSCTHQDYGVCIKSSSISTRLSVWPSSSSWLTCGSRFVALAICCFVLFQLRRLLPDFLRRLATVIALGVACLLAVSMKLISAYWYTTVALMICAYLGAHWQFFVTKAKLQKSFPGRNPSSHAVNVALEAVEIHRRVYAVVPILFGTLYVIIIGLQVVDVRHGPRPR